MNQLTVNDVNVLKQKGLLLENEIAVKEGSLIVAENVVTKERRILNTAGLILESNKQLLHD